uniref:S-adenosylmethionine:diacylglycerol 3-amino-3-carboxypropyl transferase n=1 Tax=Desulfovibrio sp. U5L TaxID=596152 RepID=I2Q5J7_9BACT
MPMTKKIATRVQDALFGSIHGQSLVYNTCWEDPRLDRRLLGLGPDSRVVVITSAGDNALDYLLDGPARVDCVDVNFRQNALLELKRALFAHATFEELYAFFGEGGGPACAGVYQRLRHTLPPYAASFWDRHIGYFRAGRLSRSFYYHGASGLAAFVFSRLISALKPGLRRNIPRLLEAGSPEEQRRVFAAIEPVFWDRLSRWLVGRPETMALLGVPRPQIDLIRHSHPGGLEGFVRDKVRHVFTGPPMAENYFWRVYLTGRYTRRCCPEYLKESRFEAIRDRLPGLAAHTDTLTGFLAKKSGPYTHFVLLDHQDWLASHAPAALAEEWDRILSCAAPGAKILMRTAGLDVSFVPQAARSRLRFFPELTEPLHAADRVGTYGSQHLAVVA